MTINKDLLVQTMQYIEDHPEEWQQTHWAMRTDCGTAFCFAGHAVVLEHPSAIFEWTIDGHSALILALSEDERIALGGDLRRAWPRGIEAEARGALGLNVPQARVLFDANNTLDDLRRHVKTLCDEGVVIDPETGIAW